MREAIPRMSVTSQISFTIMAAVSIGFLYLKNTTNATAQSAIKPIQTESFKKFCPSVGDTDIVLSIEMATGSLPESIEEKIINYADARVEIGSIVSLEERVKAVRVRYPEIEEGCLDRYREFEAWLSEKLGKEFVASLNSL